ncbi:unnamed protein product [Euphydryas editha]|uniref:Thioester reductase (TE) domain-containing protein n=1 Tax=Euphydryas editha TaxID=104508 RepID=A0AAU9UV64_EUPED|nr:unnamed protein product [Euphydryas editha]
MALTEQTDITMVDKLKDGFEDDISESQIKKLFAGATVFLTGGTGFLGKLLIDKLLRVLRSTQSNASHRSQNILLSFSDFSDASSICLRSATPASVIIDSPLVKPH